MKKFTLLFAILLFAGILKAQTNNVLLEFCTGTWCQWCPCGDAIAEQIIQAHPDATVLAYHGPTNYGDPFANFNGNNIIGLFGMSSYPTGIVGRRTGVVGRDSWFGQANIQTNNYPSPVNLVINKTMDSIARTVNVTVVATALRDIDTNVNVNFVITEDNIVYNQTGNGSCPGSSTFIHKWVTRNIVNGALGEALSTGHWAQGVVKTKSWTTTLDASWVWYNCEAHIITYFYSGSLSALYSFVLNTKKVGVNIVTGAEHQGNTVPANYILKQNYPNPFNPTTNIHFSIPKDGNVSLKIYDMLGNEITTYFNEFMKAGFYNVEFDGSKLSSGVYFYKLTAGNFSETKKMVLAK